MVGGIVTRHPVIRAKPEVEIAIHLFEGTGKGAEPWKCVELRPAGEVGGALPDRYGKGLAGSATSLGAGE